MPVIDFIEAKFSKKIFVGKLSPRSTQCTPSHRFGIESQKPGKPWGEKNLVQPREKWPGGAHKQPQPATQYYLRARSEECLRIRNKILTGDFRFNSMWEACECRWSTKTIQGFPFFWFSDTRVSFFSDFLRRETPQKSSKVYAQASWFRYGIM